MNWFRRIDWERLVLCFFLALFGSALIFLVGVAILAIITVPWPGIPIFAVIVALTAFLYVKLG